jgi:hypothetical protein
LSDAGQKNMGKRTPRWETELWSYLSQGDGINCPIYQTCELRLQGVWCLSDHEDYYEARNELIDDDDPDIADPAGIELKFPSCPRSGRIFRLVTRLATRYQAEAGIDRLPVPTNLITQAYDNLPIEVRQVPLKAYHGAVWRLSDCWMIHLNSNDTPDKRRFTLYHEIFHILAHCKATPVFKKISCSREGSFNELLADHFSGNLLVPREWATKIWPEVRDISQMAAIFEVPKSVMYLGLRGMGLI